MLTLILFLIGIGLLIGGAELLVRGASKLAIAVGIAPLVVGLTVVAFGTSSPELAVLLQASFAGKSDIAIGNVVGSNICNVLIVLGLSSLVTPMIVSNQLIRFDVPIMIGISVILMLMSQDGTVGQIDGIILFAGIIAYTFWVVRKSLRGNTEPVRVVVSFEHGKSRWSSEQQTSFIQTLARLANVSPDVLHVFPGSATSAEVVMEMPQSVSIIMREKYRQQPDLKPFHIQHVDVPKMNKLYMHINGDVQPFTPEKQAKLQTIVGRAVNINPHLIRVHPLDPDVANLTLEMPRDKAHMLEKLCDSRDASLQELGCMKIEHHKLSWFANLLMVVGGLALLVLGARWLVDGAVAFARMLGVSELIIGLTIVAVGTSLPEIATSIIAGLRGERDIVVGNVVGSNIFNILLVLGLCSIIAPIDVSPTALAVDMPVMVLVAAICFPIFYTGKLVSRWEGGLFVGYYVAYTLYLIIDSAYAQAMPLFRTSMTIFLPLTLGIVFILMLRTMLTRQPESV